MFDVRRIEFDGYQGLELCTEALRLVVVTSCGPRIAFFGTPEGENLLYWAPLKHRRGDWDMLGGHRLWTTRPGADESEESYRPDNLQCRTIEIVEDGLEVTGALDPVTLIARCLRVRVQGPRRLQVDHVIRNAGGMLWSGGVWAVTCTVPSPDSTYCIPLGDGSWWDYTRVTAFDRWAGQGGEGFEDAQFTMTRDQYQLRPSGRVNKRLLKADPGIVAMHDPLRGVLFAKQADYRRGERYPMDSNLALYSAERCRMVEMETMGSQATLKPGEQQLHRETWALAQALPQLPSNALLRVLFA